MSRRAAFLAHPAVRALLKADGTTMEPDVAIRRRARELVSWARRMGWEGPPFDMEVLASLCGYRVDYAVMGERQDGWIDGFGKRILINSENHPLRQRFTLAHEIAHTLLPDFAAGISARIENETYEWSEQSPPEQLCQIAAPELLMPMEAFREFCGGGRATIAGVRRAASRFQASVEAAARHWVALSPRSAGLIVARPETRDQAPAVLRVVASVRGGGKPLFLSDRLVPIESVIHGVWVAAQHDLRRPAIMTATEDWSRAELGRCLVEAATLPLHWSEPTSVLALLHAESAR